MSNVAGLITETVDLSDGLISLLQRAEMLDRLTEETVEFRDVYDKIKEKIKFITASMESIGEHGISQAVVTSMQIQLPGIAPDIPLNGYTKALSNHNVGYALEALSGGRVALVSSSVAAVFTFIIKAMQWVITTVKAYLKSRREINKVGIAVTTEANNVTLSRETPSDVIAALVKTKEFVNAVNGYGWLVSIRDDVGAPFPYDANALVEWWPELIKEMEYEFNAIKASYMALLNGDPFSPNISRVKDSASFSRFFKALPQGVERDGKPCSVDKAMQDFNRNPTVALTNLNTRLGQMFLVKQITNKEELASKLLDIGRSIETYTMIDRVVYDGLNNVDHNRAFDRLHADFSAMYKTVQRANYSAEQTEIDRFVGYLNIYSDKMNAFSRLITTVAYLDSMSYTAGVNLAEFVSRWSALMEDRA